ncbi:hypothetical protein C8J57DRAFT_108829 [Mycena rebaudengoi]|nr:hypothetical protein C8J57DRAFT_108829 [Mycena rebaudengoi]
MRRRHPRTFAHRHRPPTSAPRGFYCLLDFTTLPTDPLTNARRRPTSTRSPRGCVGAFRRAWILHRQPFLEDSTRLLPLLCDDEILAACDLRFRPIESRRAPRALTTFDRPAPALRAPVSWTRACRCVRSPAGTASFYSAGTAGSVALFFAHRRAKLCASTPVLRLHACVCCAGSPRAFFSYCLSISRARA